MINIGWYFYRNYFTDKVISKIDELEKEFKKDKKKLNEKIQKVFDEQNRPILQAEWDQSAALKLQQARQKISLSTIYPGLFSGSGIAHSIGETGEFKLGFCFDHTTGQPYLPGSSAKGTLRSPFPFRLVELSNRIDEKKDANTKSQLLEKAKVLLSEYWGSSDIKKALDGKSLTGKQLLQMEWEIFEGEKILNIDKVWSDQLENVKFSKFETEPLSVYDRDVFHDVFISDVKTHKQRRFFLGNDFITPHKHTDRSKKHLDALVNPVPIQFLKVLPNVSFEFQFDLKDTVIDNLTITNVSKTALFKQILFDFGIGAKTNVGYGQFDRPEEKEEEINVGRLASNLKAGDQLQAKVTSTKSGLEVDLELIDFKHKTKVLRVSPKNYSEGQIISVKVTRNNKRLEVDIL